MNWKATTTKRATIEGNTADFRMIETEAAMFAGQGVALVHIKDSTEANARLIAAAPELLEALKIALHRADQARYHTAETIEPITAEWIDGIITAARAAIAKAEGN